MQQDTKASFGFKRENMKNPLISYMQNWDEVLDTVANVNLQLGKEDFNFNFNFSLMTPGSGAHRPTFCAFKMKNEK